MAFFPPVIAGQGATLAGAPYTTRPFNDAPTNPAAMLSALASVMVPYTMFSYRGGTILIQDYTALERGAVTYPVLSLETFTITSRRVHFRTWSKTYLVRCDLIDRWDTQTATISQMWNSLTLDLRRMKSNIEDNPVLLVGGVIYSSRTTDIEIERLGASREDRTPVQTVKARMTLAITAPIYKSAL